MHKHNHNIKILIIITSTTEQRGIFFPLLNVRTFEFAIEEEIEENTEEGYSIYEDGGAKRGLLIFLDRVFFVSEVKDILRNDHLNKSKSTKRKPMKLPVVMREPVI